MDYGISFLPDATPDTKSAAEYYRDALELCEISDRSGLRWVKMTEHYLKPYGGYCPSPLAFLAAVAARTRHIRLMTGGILPVFHHPVQTAAECAMIDALSGGRLDVGFARAYLPYEFDCFGVDLDESQARFRLTVETIVRLWTERDVSVESPYFSLRNANSLPSAVQKPHPPVWGAAVRSRQGFAWLGEKGFNLMVTTSITDFTDLSKLIAIYREAYAEAHGDSRRSSVILSLPLLIAPSEAEATELADFHLARYHSVWAQAAESWEATTSKDYPGYRGFVRAIRAQTPEHMRLRRNVIVGTPDHVVQQIEWLRSQLDVDHIMWQIDFGAMPMNIAGRTLRSFVDSVMPRLR